MGKPAPSENRSAQGRQGGHVYNDRWESLRECSYGWLVASDFECVLILPRCGFTLSLFGNYNDSLLSGALHTQQRAGISGNASGGISGGPTGRQPR